MTFSEILEEARVFISQKNFNEAENIARQVLREDLENLEALKLKAEATQALGKNRSAAITYSQLGVLCNSSSFYMKAAREFEVAGDIQNAKASYKQALDRMDAAADPQEVLLVKRRLGQLH